ncbi:MAG TPA: RsmD family RNA methyltransferase [Bacteroidales bacterium]|nr:RsmD family RNA methyltransferase [Bacteroidales bacterium]HPI69297.1 RsmD family RNA methyltransferase [Bacteroidales bacterium]HPR72841.1 RsmD family RNA methyltransferase [Bacteroidales bacterium]
MRITGGKYGSRIINPPAGLKARPTTDFARVGLFNILNNRIIYEELNVLDLFSGTGSISFEFASREVASVHLIEKDSRNISGIRRMIRELGFENIKAIHIDVKSYLKICKMKYDIVFADPPYDLPWLENLPDLVIDSGIIKKDGFFILEHPRKIKFSSHKLFFEHRNYGSVNFSFFRQG